MIQGGHAVSGGFQFVTRTVHISDFTFVEIVNVLSTNFEGCRDETSVGHPLFWAKANLGWNFHFVKTLLLGIGNNVLGDQLSYLTIFAQFIERPIFFAIFQRSGKKLNCFGIRNHKSNEVIVKGITDNANLKSLASLANENEKA